MSNKMWCLINKNTGKVIKIGVWNYAEEFTNIWAVGFSTKEALMQALDEHTVEDNEVVRKVEFEL